MNGTSSLWPSLLPANAVLGPGQTAVRAHGHRVEYADGSTRLCATSGLWNVPLGYGNPAVAEAVARTLFDASYLSLFRTSHSYAEDAADALVGLAGRTAYQRLVFSTSGGAANDAAMKLVRQYWAQRGEPARSVIVGLKGGYHGTMYGSHALSGDELLQRMYSVDRRAIRHVAHDDVAELERLLEREGDRVGAVVVEPVLGSGALALSEGFVNGILEMRERHGFLLVADEVATGFGRTGPLFASGEWASAPDVLLLSKALTNGAMGAAAILIGSRVAREFIDARWTFVHGETQAGTPACAAAILAVIEELDRMDVLSTTRDLSVRLRRLADGLVADGIVVDITGRGCFLGLALAHPDGIGLTSHEVQEVVSAIADHGAIVQPGPSAIELIPAYGYDDDDLAELDAAVRCGIGWFRAGER
ncbi:MAG: daptide-type RiPP biosynthesis aminotransferase [Microbacterium sp.]